MCVTTVMLYTDKGTVTKTNCWHSRKHSNHINLDQVNMNFWYTYTYKLCRLNVKAHEQCMIDPNKPERQWYMRILQQLRGAVDI